jgi:hypothetical protein
MPRGIEGAYFLSFAETYFIVTEPMGGSKRRDDGLLHRQRNIFRSDLPP